MSQNTVVPPLPSRISQPAGSPNSSVSPARTAPTRSFTGAWRWLVPRIVPFAPAKAATCSGRTLDGPQPKRPSDGSRSPGIEMLVGSVAVLTGTVWRMIAVRRPLNPVGPQPPRK